MKKFTSILILFIYCCTIGTAVAIDIKNPSKGIYTSIDEIEKNEPKHAFELAVKKYNSVNIYFIKKVKLKYLKDVLAISDGKNLYISIGNFRGKIGFVLTNYENWDAVYSEKNTIVFNTYIPGYYGTYRFDRPAITDSSLTMIKRGNKAIYQIENFDKEKMRGKIAVSDGKNLYIKMGKYRNKPAFAKTVLHGKYYYFEIEWSIVYDESSKSTYVRGLADHANIALIKEIPKAEKVGILVDSENIEMYLTESNYQNFKIDNFTEILCEHPKLLIEFIKSNRKSLAKKKAIMKINSFGLN